MKSLFIKVKPCTVLLLLKDASQAWYPSKLARGASCSYVHVVNLLSELRKQGVVGTERKGKQNIYKLTEKGAQLASPLDDFAKKCDAMLSEAKSQQAAAAQSAQEPKQAEKPAQPEKK
jgi:predicted transcriptional regulator